MHQLHMESYRVYPDPGAHTSKAEIGVVYNGKINGTECPLIELGTMTLGITVLE